MLENLSTELDKTESRLDMVSKKVAQVLQLSDGNYITFIEHKFFFLLNLIFIIYHDIIIILFIFIIL